MSGDICSGCIAIIAEKPRAAAKIASALSRGRARKILVNGVPLWVFTANGRKYVVIPSAGHMFTVDTDKSGIPVFDYNWVPRFEAARGYGHLKKFYQVFSKILPNAREYINACDYDIEGSVIGYMIVKKWGDTSRMKRMRFSSLVEEELRRSFKNLEPLDLNMVEAGLARHEMDWIWGINVSRALMRLFKKIFGEGRVLSAGRVQTPTLFEIVRNTFERATFVPKPLYSVRIYVVVDGREYSLEPDGKPFERRSEANSYAENARKAGYARVEDIEERVARYQPPYPFNLGDVQREAYSLYKISPARVLQILEELYLESLISYPRTNSQKLPPAIDHRDIIERISRIQAYRSAASKLLARSSLSPNNGPMDDPAHPAIYPTGEHPGRLSEAHRRIYDLIVRRYLATFMDPAVVEAVRVTASVAGRSYSLRGSTIISRGWLEAYPFYRVDERKIPRLKVGDLLKISGVKVTVSYTKPEPPYNKASLLRWMESQGIGTEATRAEIIETLYRRGYVKGGDATGLGLIVYSAVERFFNNLSSVELTRHFEEMLERIRRGELSRDRVIEETKRVVGSAIERFLTSLESLDPKEARLLGAGLGGCPICRDPSEPASPHRFCRAHETAYRRLIESFKSWEGDGYSWARYLEKISGLRITGSKVREVIGYLSAKAPSSPYRGRGAGPEA